MTAGTEGAAVTVRFLTPPVPHAFVADTESTQLVKLAGQSTVTALKVFGPTMLPHVVLHVYEVAFATG